MDETPISERKVRATPPAPTTCKRPGSSGCTVRAIGNATRTVTPGPRSRRPLAAALAIALGLAACAPAPTITVTSVDVVEVGEAATELAIRIELKNNSDAPVKLDIWDYRMTACGGSYSGRWSAGITLPPEQVVKASIPAVVPGTDLPIDTCAWSTGGHVTYLTPSRLAEMLFELGLNRPTASFSQSGATLGTGGPVPSAAEGTTP